METKLYVGNLHFSISEQKLEEMFAEAGKVVSVNLIKDRDSGRSKGFAFIEMSNQVEVEEAIKQFNEYDIQGRALKVSIARPQERESRYGQRRSSGGGGYNDRRRRERNRKRRDTRNRY